METNVQSRDWWLWIEFVLDEEDVDPSVSNLGQKVEAWLATLDANVVPAPGTGYKARFDGANIHVDVAAVPRGVSMRGDPVLVGNPLPGAGFFPGA